MSVPAYVWILRTLFVLVQIPQQLGQLFWMSIVTTLLVVLGWPVAAAPLVLGVELCMFAVHQMDHHPDGWFAYPLWFLIGVIIVALGILWHGSLSGWFIPLIVGTQIASQAIHNLQPAHRMWTRQENAWLIIGGFIIAAFPPFL